MMRTTRLVGGGGFALLLALVLAATGVRDIAWAATVSVLNAIQFRTPGGSVVHAHGGGMLKVGSYYYWFGENRNADNLVSAYRSTDLRNWEFRNNVLTKTSAAELDVANIERPKVIYNALTGGYVMWMHKENGSTTARPGPPWPRRPNVDGAYTYHGSFRPLGFDSRDITLFNDNGTAYMISAARENSDLNIYRLTPDYLGVERWSQPLARAVPRGARHVQARQHLLPADLGATGWNPNQAKYATASSISGPWSGLTNFGRRHDVRLPAHIRAAGAGDVDHVPLHGRPLGRRLGRAGQRLAVRLAADDLPVQHSLTMTLVYPSLTIDTATGTVTGVPFSWTRRRRTRSSAGGATGSSTSGPAPRRREPTRSSARTANLSSQRWQLVSAGSGYYKIRTSTAG